LLGSSFHCGSVQRTSVGHAHAHGLDAKVGSVVDQRLHARDERLAALQPKALGCCVLVRQERLEPAPVV